ncbi:MAG TPA: BT_2262 family domain-containing protein [Cyclobacteriaceae bacterium]|nr:BT_2262 family domain-containing protein [Cyclobacteriaceae bacterium]
MKKYSYIKLIALLSLALFTGCEDKDSEGVSRITYYPEFTLNGDEELVLSVGDSYTESGAVVKEGDSEIEYTTTYAGTYITGPVGSIDTSVEDIYVVNYTAINKDGFPGTASRIVNVVGQGDLVNNIEGWYTSTVVRDVGGGGPAYTDMEYVIIAKTGANTYQISDGIGGYYDLGRQYGTAYAATGATLTANNIAANDFTFGPNFSVGAFGGVATLTSFEVDAGSKTIHFTSSWDAGYKFDVTLKQVQF